ncbi:2-amino-4-hydroxy-6-hydroxymethyldihydropteridine diphosphokinase [Stenoxybacter acetivorans]|uniref:2-amino-4-hydroxy-6- hydroxymethyldihydropteridine diphosphokinase n=1 Tax=Stenoxybacter acetivorans TaxID=422441 RepID=UPI00056C17D8|nr:2-amino-4-hydroxy-6-hydroxymethyldihydropteridine diphosphokinase [Stenoxybacter acetivorans]
MNQPVWHTAIIALGSNLDHPKQHIQAAVTALSALVHSRLLRVSSLYQTKPVGYLNQPDFINAAALLHTQLSAHELLAQLHQIENRFGRVRTFRNAPRTLDLDMIDYDGQCNDDSDLTLPHPRAHERAFVMLPLAEIAPDHVLPKRGRADELAHALSQNLSENEIIRLPEKLYGT